jgi:phosphatidylethanolamine/phosphatidyl-N-methylethanolamine N-methyltransferase
MNNEAKRFRPLPDYDELERRWLSSYDGSNYSGGLAGFVLKHTHSLIEKPFGPDTQFGTVLEIGAGTLAHLPFVQHRFDRYIASDHDPKVLEAAARRELPIGVELQHLVAGKLPFADNSIDRIIATHVLEHVPAPHEALAEWVRVLRPGGVLSVILPCDPGLLWRFGRMFGPRRRAVAAGLPYDYYMAREHINSIHNLATILDYHFPASKLSWWPSRLPVADLNLIYAGTFHV